ncbi:hypothetical protein ABZZ20_28590 [Streptomyces sp. NPDC006430]|uniref:hypothetical protein n=1 Tax=Streptomyces sp. NPDC006430 TaxID=3154299 RepID=UPI0033BB748B
MGARNAARTLLALGGAAAAVWTLFRAWSGNRPSRDYRGQDLFGGITGTPG